METVDRRTCGVCGKEMIIQYDPQKEFDTGEDTTMVLVGCGCPEGQGGLR